MQQELKNTMNAMQPPQSVEEIKAGLETTEKGGVRQSIRNCLTVFQRDPLLSGAIAYNILTDRKDIIKPIGFHRESTALNDTDMKYLLLYLEETYGLTNEKKIDNAIGIVANENKYHPIRDYLNTLVWDGTERIRFCLRHFLGADADDYTYEALKLFLLGAISRAFQPGCKFEIMLCLAKLPNKVPLPFTKGGGRCAILVPEFPVKSIHTERSFVSMSQAAAQQPSRKKTAISLLVLLVLTCIIVFTFKDHWAEITTALAQLSVWQVLAVLAVGLSYPLLEGCVAWVIVRSRLPQFKLWQGLDVGWCGTFGNVVTLGAGAVPVQLYYLHKAGLPLGPGAGLMTLEYVFHKSTVLLYATVMLLLQRRWLAANTTGVMRYLPMAYAVVAVVIVALVLLCVSPLVQNLARWLLGFLPKTEKWQQRRADWLEQLEVLGTESRRLLADKPRCLKIFALQALKLFGLFCLPYLCIRFMGLSPLGFWQVQLLTSLMLFVSNALPNVAGMGSIETAFLLVFGSFLERGEVMSVLMLYRIASYYVVFAASAVGFFIAQRHLTQMEPPKEG